MYNINDIYEMLDQKNSIEIQEEGIKLAKKIDDLSFLILPPSTASVWERCAEILSEKSDDDLELYLNELLDWLYDLNWPGAETILERLLVFPGEKLISPFLKSIHKAENDREGGTRWLNALSELGNNGKVKVFLPNFMLKKLKLYYRNW